MRLINVRTYEVVEHMTDDDVPYAILSHTWEAEEVTLQEMNLLDESIKAKKGFKKIEYTCLQALREGLDWAWVDTCCIDKTSSAELSEAINSMFRWYRQSQVCYVYLADQPDQPDDASLDTRSLARCRWFTRGWCLQELLAPTSLVFYSHGWDRIGTLSSLVDIVSEITRIDEDYLTKKLALDDASIAARMSWAAGRRCSRLEDRAYSLLGIFDVNIPLLYGEGPKAFIRLQEEIWRETDDHSLLAWHVPDEDPRAWQATSVFAESPDDFRFSSQVVSAGLEDGVPSGMTKRGLSLFVSTQELAYPFRSDWSVYQIPLNCADIAHGVENEVRQIMVLAAGVSNSKHTFIRVATPAHFYRGGFRSWESRKANKDGEGSVPRTIYIPKNMRSLLLMDSMKVEMPGSDVLFHLEGPMHLNWYENEWGKCQRRDGSRFPGTPWCPMGPFRWFQDSNAKYTKITDSAFFILQMGDWGSPYMDNTAAVIKTAGARWLEDHKRYAQFLLVEREELEMAGGFRVGMRMPVEIRCAICLVPWATQASIALLPWDEDERAKEFGPLWDGDIRAEREKHQKMMEKWTVRNLGRSPTMEDAEGRLLLAQASLDLKKSWNKRRRLCVEMLVEKRLDRPWEDWRAYECADEYVTPHIHLRFTMVNL